MSGYPTSKRFVLDLPTNEAALALAGEAESTLHSLGALTGASLVLRGLQVVIQGLPSQMESAASVLELLRPIWQEGQSLSVVDLQNALGALKTGRTHDHQEMGNQILAKCRSGKILRPRTLRQKKFIDAMETHDLTFALGPAGTGKTFLAAVLAVRMLTDRKVKKLILTRPAVEAGERLGFLPGDLQQKVDPYLRPLYDSLHALLGTERTTLLLEKGIIEVAPLAYMRGRTLDNAFIILDEAQNTTPAQMKMVLTRLGENSRMVVTGDITQIDLGYKQTSGLVHAAEVLKDVVGVAICRLTSSDVIRHILVQRVIDAYEVQEEIKTQSF